MLGRHEYNIHFPTWCHGYPALHFSSIWWDTILSGCMPSLPSPSSAIANLTCLHVACLQCQCSCALDLSWLLEPWRLWVMEICKTQDSFGDGWCIFTTPVQTIMKVWWLSFFPTCVESFLDLWRFKVIRILECGRYVLYLYIWNVKEVEVNMV